MNDTNRSSVTPEYVDTATPAVQWYGYNIALLVANIVMMLLAALLLEHELAKLRNPDAVFVSSPVWLNLPASLVILILGIINVAVLIFTFLRHLWLRRWMVATTVISWMLLAALALVLRERFLPILVP